MGGLLLLLALCAVMAFASFLAGALPLSMSLTQSQLRLISSIGVGILVGTSLIVIIPEGVEAIANPMLNPPGSPAASHKHSSRHLPFVNNKVVPEAAVDAAQPADASHVFDEVLFRRGSDSDAETAQPVDASHVFGDILFRRDADADKDAATKPADSSHVFDEILFRRGADNNAANKPVDPSHVFDEVLFRRDTENNGENAQPVDASHVFDDILFRRDADSNAEPSHPVDPSHVFDEVLFRRNSNAKSSSREEEEATDGTTSGKTGSGSATGDETSSDATKHHQGFGKAKQKQEGAASPTDEPRSLPTFFIGFALVTGFVLMFLIDRLPRHAVDKLQSGPTTRHISLDNLASSNMAGDSDEGAEEEGFLGSLTPTPRQSRGLATTVGLVIHAAADGIAMGASATTEDMKLGLVIFVAIMVHKAPAAFGLTSVLLKHGLSKRAARGHLVVFSLAAPFGALGTYILIKLLGGGNMEGERGQWWTGMLLLFSAGTFLYVAMQAMQEEAGGHDHHSLSNGYSDAATLAAQRKQSRPQMRDTLATIAGMLLPLLTQFGHHH